jgi:uncharacterized protein YukE
VSVNSWVADHAAAGLEAAGVQWPGGDATVLRDLSAAWREMAESLRTDARELDDAVTEAMQTWTGPAAGAFAAHWAEQREEMQAAADSLEEVAGQLTAYADEIEALLSEIIEIGLEIAEAIGIGVALTAVTAGVSTVIASGVAAWRITRATQLVAQFGSAGQRVAVLLVRLEQAMARLAQVLRPLAELVRQERVRAVGRDIAVDATANFVGSTATQALTGEGVEYASNARDAGIASIAGVPVTRGLSAGLDRAGIGANRLVNRVSSNGAGGVIGALTADGVNVGMGWKARDEVDYSADAALNGATGASSAAAIHGVGSLDGAGRHRAEGVTDLGAAGGVAFGSTASTGGNFISERSQDDHATTDSSATEVTDLPDPDGPRGRPPSS